MYMKGIIVYLVAFLPLTAFAQHADFTTDSIREVDGEVVFKVDFKYDLRKEDFHKKAYAYLNDVLNPYSGVFSADNEDYTTCQIIDYIDIENSLFQKFGMYMRYILQLKYHNGNCDMIIRDISYTEKGYFELNEKRDRKRDVPEYTAKDIMIDHTYSLMLIRKASERITTTSLERINGIIQGLEGAFAKR